MKKGKSFRLYRKKAPTSQVDESLFCYSKTPSKETQDRETVWIITKEQIRELRVSSKDHSQDLFHLPAPEMQRILSASRARTKTERKAKRQAYEEKKDEDIKAAEARKKPIMELDLLREQNKPPTEEEIAANKWVQTHLDRATALRMEQDEDIKKVNKIILGAECQATCENQVAQKKRIQACLAEEETRLNAMMENERCKAVETMIKNEELHRQKLRRGMEDIFDQILTRQEEKNVLQEMEKEEKQRTQENHERMKLEDLEAKQKKKEDQRRLQEEIKRINTEIMLAKERRKEEEKLADIKDEEYNEKKLKQEEERAEEQRRIKKAKEVKTAKLLAQHKKSKDKKAEEDAIYAHRVQVMKDREWRKKEREEAEKKAKNTALMHAARKEQHRFKEQQMFMDIRQQKIEFDEMLKVQQEAIAKEKEEEERKRLKAQHHKEALQRQMTEREFLAKMKRKEILKVVDQANKDAKEREIHLRKIKERKLKELQATGVPEKYCAEVERKIFDRGAGDKLLKARVQKDNLPPICNQTSIADPSKISPGEELLNSL